MEFLYRAQYFLNLLHYAALLGEWGDGEKKLFDMGVVY